MQLDTFVNTLKTNNAKGYLVGGAVRDSLMGKIAKDNDYCVTGISQETFESLFPTAELQGKDFPVYRMDIDGEYCEVALARTERKTSTGHKGFTIHTSPTVTIEEDLARRDFTINAMAIDLETKELIDPFYGQEDLNCSLLRATTKAFREDPLRVYRAARFCARYGFSVEYGTMQMMKSLKAELSSLSIGRVLEETNKAFMTDTPSLFFRTLKEAEVLDVHFPEIDCLSEFEQNPEHHPEGNVFEHTMQVVDAARYLCDQLPADSELIVMYSALLHDVGKAVTKGIHPIKGTVTYITHESAGVPIAEKFLERFNLKSCKKAILFNVSAHMVFHGAFTTMRIPKAVDFVEGKFELDGDSYIRKPGIVSSNHILDYSIVCIADAIGRLKEPRKLGPVLKLTANTLTTFRYRVPFYIKGLFSELIKILGDYDSANRVYMAILIAAQHKAILEIYHEDARRVTCSLDIEELKTKYQGEKLGYVIHSDKRKQRIAIMKESRNKIKEYLETVKE
ncbi:tRNA nucleotidyltransferase [Priestia megaterium]|uniref:HDIG domain-containing metalloprotein n=1 Tax=Priestia megaterium TaxID=1404 RepID=UPI000BF82BCD|nr:HDIG domain-containing metalloprotein [Priestia megaterium]PFK99952.1 tRNA nucleotidyltransferase [Priestia megaterium]